MQFLHLAVGAVYAIDHRGRGRDQVQVEFAGQPFLDDLQVQQSQEAAAEAEPQRRRCLRVVVEARVVQPQPSQAFPQLLEIVGIDGIQAAPHHRHRRLEPGQRLGGRRPVVGDRVADRAIGHRLDRCGDEADLARSQIVRRDHLRAEDAHLLDLMDRAVGHHADALAALQPSVLDADQDHHAEILVVPAIDQQRLQRRGAVALRWRQAMHQGLQHALDVQAGLGADLDRVGGIEADHVLDLLLHLLRFGGREVDLVEDGHDLVVGLDGLIDVGERLRLDPLTGIHHQQRTLAGGQAAADLVGEIDVAGRVHQVQFVDLPVLRLVGQPDGLRLDRDAALALQVHVVEHLIGHLPRGERAGGLDQAVGQGGFPVVDMRDDREIADMVERRVGHFRWSGTSDQEIGHLPLADQIEGPHRGVICCRAGSAP